MIFDSKEPPISPKPKLRAKEVIELTKAYKAQKLQRYPEYLYNQVYGRGLRGKDELPPLESLTRHNSSFRERRYAVELEETRAALRKVEAERDAVKRDHQEPPKHWTENDGWKRHPQTAQEWDWKQDEQNRLTRGIQRLNFAADKADPHASDQMAMVLRLDLIVVLGQLVHRESQFRMLRDKVSAAESANAELQQRVAELEYALTAVEWGIHEKGIGRFCPTCLNNRFVGHKSDCGLFHALRSQQEGAQG